MSTVIEAILQDWAKRVLAGRVGPRGYPTSSWSKAMASRKGGTDNGKRTAEGKESRSMKPMDEPEDWGLDAEVEAAVARMHTVHPILWSVGTAYYLGNVPVGFRAAAKQRRRRFGRDDTTGLIRVSREFLRRQDEDTETKWKANIARRLTMTPRTFEINLVRFRDCMALLLADEISTISAKKNG